MTPARRWMLWAVALFAITGILDAVLFNAGTAAANARPVQEAGVVVSRVLGASLLLGLVATALFWWRGRTQDAGNRLVATIAFLIAQGLLFAFMSMATLLATPHRNWNELAAHPQRRAAPAGWVEPRAASSGVAGLPIRATAYMPQPRSPQPQNRRMLAAMPLLLRPLHRHRARIGDAPQV